MGMHRISLLVQDTHPDITGLDEAHKSAERVSRYSQGKGISWRDDPILVGEINKLQQIFKSSLSNQVHPLDKTAHDKYIMDLKVAALIDRKLIQYLQEEALKIFLRLQKEKEAFLERMSENAKKAEELNQNVPLNKEINLPVFLTQLDIDTIKALENCLEHMRFLNFKIEEIEKEKVKVYEKVGQDIYQHFEIKAKERGRPNILKDIPPEEKKEALIGLGKVAIEKKEEIKQIQVMEEEVKVLDKRIEEVEQKIVQEEKALEEMKHLKDAIYKDPLVDEAEAVKAAMNHLQFGEEEPDARLDEDLTAEEQDEILVELDAEDDLLSNWEEDMSEEEKKQEEMAKAKAKEEQEKLLSKIENESEKKLLKIKAKIKENKEKMERLQAKLEKNGKKIDDLKSRENPTAKHRVLLLGRKLINRRRNNKIKMAEKAINSLRTERNEIKTKRDNLKASITASYTIITTAIKDTWFKLPFYKNNKDKKPQDDHLKDVVVDMVSINSHIVDEPRTKIDELTQRQKECHDQVKAHQETARKLVKDRFEQFPLHENNSIRELAAKIEQNASKIPKKQDRLTSNI